MVVSSSVVIIMIVIVIGITVASIKVNQHNKKHNLQKIVNDKEDRANRREEIRKARSNVLAILPLVSENREIMDFIKGDLEDMKSSLMADKAGGNSAAKTNSFHDCCS